MTMEERLNAISIDKKSLSGSKQPPRADTLAILLTQGLQSQDKKILNVSIFICQEKFHSDFNL